MLVSGIISAILIGIVLGVFARLTVPSKQNIPFWLTILVGIGAALLGTAFARGLGYGNMQGWDWLELLTQFVFAAIGVAIVEGVYPKKRIGS